MGAWAWGDTDGYFGNTMTGEDFRPIFDAAVKAGLNLWDTATAYSNGESEKILGTMQGVKMSSFPPSLRRRWQVCMGTALKILIDRFCAINGSI